MKGEFTAPQLWGRMMESLENHPAIVAYRSGKCTHLLSGLDFEAFVVVIAPPLEGEGEFIVTVWNDGDIGVQRV